MKCTICGEELTRMVRISEDQVETQNQTWICENPKCSLYIDFSKVKNWKFVSRPKRKPPPVQKTKQ